VATLSHRQRAEAKEMRSGADPSPICTHCDPGASRGKSRQVRSSKCAIILNLILDREVENTDKPIVRYNGLSFADLAKTHACK